MHVAVATTVHHPADARIAARQIPALLDASHEVTYVAAFAARSAPPPPGVSPVDVPRSSGRHRLGALRRAAQVLRQLGREVDLVLVHDPELLAVAVGWGDRAPFVWDVHEDTPASLSDRPWIPDALTGALSRLVRSVEARADRHLHLLLAEDRYRERFAHPHPVVHNYPLVPESVPPSGPGRAVYLGRLSASRGLPDLVTLGRRLRDEVAVELIGAPDPSDAAVLDAGVRRGDVVADGVHVPNARALSRVEGATVGLNLVHDHPNHMVSLQTKVLEYLARGVPVVTTPLPAAVEMVERHGCGVVVPFRDVDAAVRAVQRLHREDDERRTMADRGREAVREHYNWSVEGRRFVDLLEGWAR